MGAGVRPERPSIESLLAERPSVESLLAGEPTSPMSRALRRHDPSAVAKIVGRQNTNDAEAAEGPSYRERFGGNVANLVRDVPGAEAVTSGVHAVLKRQPYAESLREVRGAADAVPGAVKWPTRIAGGATAGAILPGSALRQGVTFGALSGALQADPDADVGDRVADAAIGAGVGAVGAKIPGMVRGTLSNASLARDVGLSLVGSSGAKRRLAGRVVSAVRDVTKTAPAAVQQVERSALNEPKRLLDISEPDRLIRPKAPKAPKPAATAEPVTESARDKAIREGSKVFNDALEEGGAANWTPEAMAAREGVPLDPEPPTNWDLMEKMERGLVGPNKPLRTPALRKGAGTVADSVASRGTVGLAKKATASPYPEHPRAGKQTPEGLEVGKKVDNTDSIAATFNEGEYAELPGIRQVDLLGDVGPNSFRPTARVKQLAEEIRANRRIDPLIWVDDPKGGYVLEGAHRIDALRYLGHKSFPAVVIHDLSSLATP